ncbi:YvrJ family protein [Halalkalibacter nanhaiisediminis]|uniref:YvrJ-like protein n=1 Tax=Halalkalibacter nanhaiisediminis TaxID=688079 RepID=A0A562QMF1_9BACI|nr:YvrJ family protein [Halalkalibacter nanhaiisediminis]TWI57853.1 YvrJ-like protein [Halalkalibacter nanhaiisediminis]
MSTLELWIPLLGEYGFPVMVTFYLLHRLEQKLDNVTAAVEHLPTKLSESHKQGIRQIK